MIPHSLHNVESRCRSSQLQPSSLWLSIIHLSHCRMKLQPASALIVKGHRQRAQVFKPHGRNIGPLDLLHVQGAPIYWNQCRHSPQCRHVDNCLPPQLPPRCPQLDLPLGEQRLLQVLRATTSSQSWTRSVPASSSCSNHCLTMQSGVITSDA